MTWDPVAASWRQRSLMGSRWQAVRDGDLRTWVVNKYRVLLTRARLGMVIWVPRGEVLDDTRDPEEYDLIAKCLQNAGVRFLCDA